MNGQPAGWARMLGRAAALAMGLFVLVYGASCDQQSFDLLGIGGAPAAGGSNGSVAGGASTAGRTNSAGSAGSDRDAGPTKGGTGGGGNGAFGGGAQGGSSNTCPLAEGCLDGGLICSPTASSCKSCSNQGDCGHGAPPYCDPFTKLCVECRKNGSDCNAGETCDSFSLRCEKYCQTPQDCDSDSTRPVCSDRGLCVECRDRADCKLLRPQDDYVCYGNFCVECAANSDCESFDRPVCQAFHCVPRR